MKTPSLFRKKMLTVFAHQYLFTLTHLWHFITQFLITHSFSKHFTVAAFDVPCVSHVWIVDSCRQNSLLDHRKYLLPRGLSIETEALVEQPSGRSMLGVFREKKFLLCSQVRAEKMCTTDNTSPRLRKKSQMLTPQPFLAARKHPWIIEELFQPYN